MANLYRYFHRVEEPDSPSELETEYESDETVLVDDNQRPASPPTPAPLPMRYWEDNAEDDENAWDEAFDRQLYLEMIGDEVPSSGYLTTRSLMKKWRHLPTHLIKKFSFCKW